MPLPRKIWFKLQQLKSSWQETFGGAGKGQHYDSTYRMCPECRGLIERGASVCPLCGASTKAPRSRPSATPGRVLGVIPVPTTATSILMAANILLYVLTWYLTQEHAAATLTQAPGWGGISGPVLDRLGDTRFMLVFFDGQWWRLVTAMFLHLNLLHIGMNMWVLLDIGPMAEQLFSSAKFLVFYLVTGVAGFLTTVMVTHATSAGASGAIMGLIGVIIGVSFHHGSLGKEYRSRLWLWVFYIILLSLVAGGDNAAHIGGAATGIVLGYTIPEGEPSTRAEETLWGLLAVFAVIVIAGSFALMALQLNQPPR